MKDYEMELGCEKKNMRDYMQEHLKKKIEILDVYIAYVQDMLAVRKEMRFQGQKIVSSDEYNVFLRGCLLECIIVNLSKLYDKSNDANTIYNLLDKCKKNSRLADDENKLLSVLDDCRKELDNREIADIIRALQNLRDKLYAHNDDKFFGPKMADANLECFEYKLQILANSTEKILHQLSSVFGTEIFETKFKQKDLVL